MSWWNIPDSIDDVTGDAPADAVDAALLGLAEARKRSGNENPSLPELLRALTDALSKRRDLVENLPAEFTVTTKEGVEAAAKAPDDLSRAVEQALEGIAGAYTSYYQRKPRPAEILYAFTFVLNSDLNSVLSGSFPTYVVIQLR